MVYYLKSAHLRYSYVKNSKGKGSFIKVLLMTRIMHFYKAVKCVWKPLLTALTKNSRPVILPPRMLIIFIS